MKWLAFTRHLLPALPLPGRSRNQIPLLDAEIAAWASGCAGCGGFGGSEGPAGAGSEGCSIAWRRSGGRRPKGPAAAGAGEEGPAPRAAPLPSPTPRAARPLPLPAAASLSESPEQRRSHAGEVPECKRQI